VTTWLSVIVFVIASLLAIGADLWDIGLEPITILTIALVGATIYYALQNRDMADSLRAQIVETRAADASRQRDVQILDVDPFLAPEPQLAADRSSMRITLGPRRRPALHVGVTLRAMRETPEAGSSDGRGAVSGGLGSHPPGADMSIRLPLAGFLRAGPTDVVPFEDVWEVNVTHNGMLGQWVVETYEWRIRDLLASHARSVWQLRRLVIQPAVPGARSLELPFGDE
jgi:hypothetical protein